MNVHRAMIDERSAWKSGAIGGKEGLVLRFSPDHLDAIDRLVRQARALPPDGLTRAAFDDPGLDAFLEAVSNELSVGRGAVILSGLSATRYGEQDLARILWGIGTHLGIGVAQNIQGDRIDHIRDSADNPLSRKQYGRAELVLHSDNPSGEILGLLSVQKARRGGLSQLASALAVHNEIFRTRPDLLEPLYVGFPYHRKGRQRPGEPMVTPFRVPVFCAIDGIVSCHYIREYMETAAETGGTPMPALFREALDYFDEIANRDDIKVTFMLEPGELMLVNNLTVLHARTAFEDDDDPALRRHLLRLWLHVPGGRPFAPTMDMFWTGPGAGQSADLHGYETGLQDGRPMRPQSAG